jgi:predicted dehydrogenase
MPHSIDRRKFLEKTSLGLAGVTAATNIGFSEDQSSRRVVVGVMGLSRGRSLAQQFSKQKNVEVRYVCDVDSTRAKNLSMLLEKTGVKRPKAIEEFQEILDDKEVDALICAAPNHWHAPATISACKSGKHVYVEKPCSHNPYEGELMVEAARKYNRAVQMGSQRRSALVIQEAMELLHSGEIGKVYSARAYYASKRASIGIGKKADVPANLNYELWQGPAPRLPYMDNRVHYQWHWFWHYGNGELGNNGVHTLDLCRWGLNVDYPIKVTSNGGRYRYEDDQQTPDTHVVGFEFAGKKMITWQGHSCNIQDNFNFITFYGEKGSLKLKDKGDYTLYDDKNKVLKEKISDSRGDIPHIVDFLTAIRQEKPLNLNAEIEKGYKSTLLCHLGNIAQRTGRTLNCNPGNGHILGDEKAMSLWKREYEPGWEPTV